MAESQKHSKAQKLLSEYRPAVWRKSALEAVPGTGRKALYACIEQMRFTEGLVEALRNTRLLGEKLYWVVYATYMTERQPGDVNEILDHIAKNHEYIPRRTYFRLKGRALEILDKRLEERPNESLVSGG